MLDQATHEDYRPSAVSRVPWHVAEVEALPEFCLRVRFNDGVEGIVDMAREVHAPDAGVFAALADPGLFTQVGIEMGAVWWPGELDLPPDAMHDEIVEHGQWVL